MTKWRSPESGPDWIDIRMLLGSMMTLHKCDITLIMSPDGMHDGPGSRVVALAISNMPMEGLDQGQLSVSNVWPNRQHGTMTGMLYELLLTLDNEILRKWWNQKGFA